MLANREGIPQIVQAAVYQSRVTVQGCALQHHGTMQHAQLDDIHNHVATH